MKSAAVIPITKEVLQMDEYDTRAARIKAVFLEKKEPLKKGNVGKASTLRERILLCSLFPNLYNQKYLERQG